MDEEPVIGREYRLPGGRVALVLDLDRWRVRVSVYEEDDPDCNYVSYFPREEFWNRVEYE